jgi:DNA-binding transcriptional LysR family regulator
MAPSPAELIYFQEIANASNFSRAASKLGVSQPSLSLAIKRLEKTIGANLFVRHKQGATLTPAGKKLYLQTKVLLDNWENIRLEAAASHQQIQGEITLGCHTTVARYLRSFLPELLEQHPKLTFNLKHDISQAMTEQVIHSRIDIALVSNPFKHPDLIIRKLDDSETTFWKGAGLRPMQDIHSDQLVIICDPNIPRTPLLLNKWKNKKLKSARIVTSNSLEIVADLTAGGCGIGILPSCFARSVYPGKLERIPNTPVCYDELYLVYRKENRDVVAVLTVIAAIKKFAEENKQARIDSRR